ncbi:MAG: hypothetical protein KatS3mg111_3552 [Pirellulaceae bacterium]|nr:MAG: hypothetical protein KatS3mg111_3552 [Pirellulaceae bacterium]
MSWTMYRWGWQLQSPLRIGWLPAGALNRARLYVPARGLWGAFTAEIARRGNANFPDYHSIGEELQRNTRFSYLFPAEQVDGEWQAWLPEYQPGQGLMWKREDGKAELEERRFRVRLLTTRPGTAIEPTSDTAEEGTLREFELIGPWWRPLEGEDLKPVAMVGYLFCRDRTLGDQIQGIQEIFVGGDIRYGLGRLRRVILEEAKDLFGSTVDLSGDSPAVCTGRVLAHTLPQRINLLGSRECIGGWDMSSGGMIRARLVGAPGCSVDQERTFATTEDGVWEAR